MSANEIMALLRKRYGKPGWAMFAEVSNGTGMSARRRADAVAMGIWPSTGLALHGHEIKVSRGDWLREIQDPTKADAVRKYCHFWWVVAPPGVVEIAELPASWGLMEANGDGLRVRSAADRTAPESLSYEFVASLLRRAAEHSPSKEELSAQYRQGVADGRKAAEESTKRESDRQRQRDDRQDRGAKLVLDKFFEATGVHLSEFDAERYANAAAVVMHAERMRQTQESFEHQARQHARLAEAFRRAVDECGK